MVQACWDHCSLTLDGAERWATCVALDRDGWRSADDEFISYMLRPEWRRSKTVSGLGMGDVRSAPRPPTTTRYLIRDGEAFHRGNAPTLPIGAGPKMLSMDEMRAVIKLRCVVFDERIDTMGS